MAAKIQRQRVKPLSEGGCEYSLMSEIVADDKGRRVMKNAPVGQPWGVVQVDGYVSRIVAHMDTGDQPRWHACDCGLSRPAPVSGRVVDGAGKLLIDVRVRLGNVVSKRKIYFESLREYSTTTDANGNFRLDNVPAGNATIRIRKSGYCRAGWGDDISTPRDKITLQMVKVARLNVTVDLTGKQRRDEMGSGWGQGMSTPITNSFPGRPAGTLYHVRTPQRIH